jgi:hypothetical protein
VSKTFIYRNKSIIQLRRALEQLLLIWWISVAQYDENPNKNKCKYTILKGYYVHVILI